MNKSIILAGCMLLSSSAYAINLMNSIMSIFRPSSTSSSTSTRPTAPSATVNTSTVPLQQQTTNSTVPIQQQAIQMQNSMTPIPANNQSEVNNVVPIQNQQVINSTLQPIQQNTQTVGNLIPTQTGTQTSGSTNDTACSCPRPQDEIVMISISDRKDLLDNWKATESRPYILYQKDVNGCTVSTEYFYSTPTTLPVTHSSSGASSAYAVWIHGIVKLLCDADSVENVIVHSNLQNNKDATNTISIIREIEKCLLDMKKGDALSFSIDDGERTHFVCNYK